MTFRRKATATKRCLPRLPGCPKPTEKLYILTFKSANHNYNVHLAEKIPNPPKADKKKEPNSETDAYALPRSLASRSAKHEPLTVLGPVAHEPRPASATAVLNVSAFGGRRSQDSQLLQGQQQDKAVLPGGCTWVHIAGHIAGPSE